MGASIAVPRVPSPSPTTSQEQAGLVEPLPEPFLVPVLTLRQELVLRLLTLGWSAATAWFWLWWLASARGEWNIGRTLSTAGLAWLTVLAAYFLFFVCRMTRPNPRRPVPRLRVAMIVTKAPSEPWEVVRHTLQAMLAQDLPYSYDVWLADERPSGKALRWCRGHGVQVSTRYGVAEYHQPAWPRRTRCKEGNLAYFYDRHGYDRYDVVSQLDADHVPASNYLSEMVRPFGDPGVGYVAAPSICDSNAARGWTVRGRLYREASMHGPVQAGCNGGWAPVCIGSHYAVRTQALKAVGGVGPDLAEDYSTTLWLQSAGWRGVFAIDADAHGEGPESLDDMLVQELQWARSLGTIMTRWAPGRLRRCAWRARIRLAFALFYYLIQGLMCVAALPLPIMGVALGLTWGNTTLGSFYAHLWLCALFLTLAQLWLRHCRVLRPIDARLWCYELMLFQLVRWPWTTWGFFQGMWAGLRESPTNFRVTPKGTQRARPLSLGLLLPVLALTAVSALVAGLVPDPTRSLGLYLVLMLQTLLYALTAVTVVVLHVRGNRVAQRRPGLNWLGARHESRLVVKITPQTGGLAAALTGPVVLASAGTLVWCAVRL